MNRALLPFFGLLFCLSGCAANRIALPRDPLRLTIIQRTDKVIPGSHRGARIKLGDITQGQVLLSIRGPLGQPIVDTTSVREGDVVPFQCGKNAYYLTVVELRNLVVGDDFAVFDVSSMDPKRAPQSSPEPSG